MFIISMLILLLFIAIKYPYYEVYVITTFIGIVIVIVMCCFSFSARLCCLAMLAGVYYLAD